MNQTSKLNLEYFDVSWRGYTEIVDRNVSLFCETNPIESNSHGIWERMSYKTIGMRFWEYPLPNLEIIMFSTYALWRLIDKGFNRIGFRAPRFTYMMIAGVIIGQTCHLSNNSWLHGIFFPDDHRAKAAETLGAFSFLLYWFLKGVTMDVGVGLKMGRKAVVIGLTTTLIPLICGNIMLKRKLRGGSSLSAMEFRLIIFMQSVSPFTSIDTLLKDLKIKHSEFGRIALAGAMVTDVLAFGITWMNAIHWDGSAGLVKSIYAASFFTFLVYVVRPSMIWVVKQTPEGRPVKDAYIYTILGLAFLSFKFFEWIHYFGATGPFVFGLSVPEGYPMGSTLVQKFESFNLGAILPLFVSMTMTQVDFLWLFKECGNFIRMEGKLYEIISFIFVMTLTKVFASIIAARTFKMPLRDSIALALVYSSKGIFELSYYTFAVEIKRIRPEVFTILATFILVNSIFIPLALELVHDPTERFKCYRKRNLAILKDGAELPCLVCIYKPDHISSMTNVLTDINPSRDSPMACNVLHLIELVGQANPMFISHQLQKPEPGSTSCSDTVINSFRKFHQNFYEYTALNIFTSISMSKHMHEDICWLALSKSLSLILLPFHRTWSADRATVSNDDKLRMINLNVLKRAPCSVGIFICRKPIESHTIQNKVCLIFNGGKDDKEALVIAKRMRLNQKGTNLTIIRFVPKILKQDNQELEAAFPMVSLEETVTGNIGSNVKENDDENVTYIDKAVADGSETSRILREMRNDFDLFIVGKGSGVGIEATSGLGAWTEFEELGPLGDLLASHEYISRASVLVVKTQEYVHQTKGLKQKYN